MIRIVVLTATLALLPSGDCTFLRNPDAFFRSPEEQWREVSERTRRAGAKLRLGPAFYLESADRNTKTPRGTSSMIGFEYVPSTNAGPAQPVRELFLY